MHDTGQHEKAAGGASRREMTIGEAEAWREGAKLGLFLMADMVCDTDDGGVAGNHVLRAIARLRAGERFPAEGSEADWPLLRAVHADIDAVQP